MFYRSARKEDLEDIITLARESGQDMVSERVAEHSLVYPSEVALDEKDLLGFALSEAISYDILLVHSLAVREELRCDKIGRSLLEIVESKAVDKGYHTIIVSGFVQSALLGCASDIITFAGYSDICNTGGSRLLAKSIN